MFLGPYLSLCVFFGLLSRPWTASPCGVGVDFQFCDSTSVSFSQGVSGLSLGFVSCTSTRLTVSFVMSFKIAIPTYNPDKSYEIFKSELKLWEAVTDLTLAKRGAAVALTLPDNERCTLRKVGS